MLRTPRIATIALLLVASFALFAAACGGDDDEDSSPTSTFGPTVTPIAGAVDATETPANATPAETDEPFEGGRDPVEGAAQGSGIPVLTDVRTGEHAGYDRITFEFEGNERPHYLVEYIDAPATQCGSGADVTIEGAALVRVQFQPANAHNETGGTAIEETELSPALTTLLEAELFCDFEADVQWALGLAQEADFRVLELDNPPRIAVDVAHP